AAVRFGPPRAARRHQPARTGASRGRRRSAPRPRLRNLVEAATRMARQESKLALRTCSESLPGITKECSSDMTLSRAAQRAVGKEGRVNADFFSAVGGPIPFGGLDSSDPLTYKVYEADRLVLGTRMEDDVRIAICICHSFNWPGSDVFGLGTLIG